MSATGVEGATAAALYFLDLYPYIYATGDTAGWREMSAPTCDFCLESATDAEELIRSGKRGGTPLEVVSTDGTDLKEGQWFAVRIRAVQPATFETDSEGNRTRTGDGGTYEFDFALSWADRWVVDSIGVQPSAQG